MNAIYWLLFAVRAVLFAVILHNYGWKASALAFVYAIATALSEVVI